MKAAAGVTSEAATASAPRAKAGKGASGRPGAGHKAAVTATRKAPERLGHDEGLLPREPGIQRQKGQRHEGRRPGPSSDGEPDEKERSDREEKLDVEEEGNPGPDPAHHPDEEGIPGGRTVKGSPGTDPSGSRGKVVGLRKEAQVVHHERRPPGESHAEEQPGHEEQPGSEDFLPVVAPHSASLSRGWLRPAHPVIERPSRSRR